MLLLLLLLRPPTGLLSRLLALMSICEAGGVVVSASVASSDAAETGHQGSPQTLSGSAFMACAIGGLLGIMQLLLLRGVRCASTGGRGPFTRG